MFKGGVDDRKVLGDATDSGLLRYCDRLAPSSLVRMAYKKVSRSVHLQAPVASVLLCTPWTLQACH